MSKLLQGDVKGHLLRFTLPSIAGTFAMLVFNLADTLFVSRRGTESLTAMGCTFAVVMIVGALGGGVPYARDALRAGPWPCNQ